MAEQASDGQPARLDDPAVRVRLAALDEQLARLETTPGPIGELALAAVSGLAEIYGQALTRVLDIAGPAAVERMLADELLGHLLTLHRIDPRPIETRVRTVLDRLTVVLVAQVSDIELTGIDRAVAVIRVTGRGCGGGSNAGIERSVRDAVLLAAPELSDVTVVPTGRPSTPAFVPLTALLPPRRAAEQR